MLRSEGRCGCCTVPTMSLLFVLAKTFRVVRPRQFPGRAKELYEDRCSER